MMHPVPIEENAIAMIANNSMAIDVYCWLAYRLHSLTTPNSSGSSVSGTRSRHSPLLWKADVRDVLCLKRC